MKSIAILGSTGSIGTSALQVVRRRPKDFKVDCLAANSNITVLAQQVKEFKPAYICVADYKAAARIKKSLSAKVKLFCGEDGIREALNLTSAKTVLLAISGFEALSPLIAAIDKGKDIALANKEALVVAGKLLTARILKSGARILPVDSEQSAIWQCLRGQGQRRLKKIYLTASGGPLRNLSFAQLREVSVAQVLRHPCWKMGRKITVDSATLMNKGLEFLEAMFLFGVSPKDIEVLIHPEAIIHSMVEFVDGVVMAQLSNTDMRIPIQYAFTFPDRMKTGISGIDFIKLRSLSFESPDLNKFPCLRLAIESAKKLGTLPAALNASNEVAVAGFLEGRLRFKMIPKVIEKVLSRHRNTKNPGFPEIRQADAWAREEALRCLA